VHDAEVLGHQEVQLSRQAGLRVLQMEGRHAGVVLPPQAWAATGARLRWLQMEDISSKSLDLQVGHVQVVLSIDCPPCSSTTWEGVNRSTSLISARCTAQNRSLLLALSLCTATRQSMVRTCSPSSHTPGYCEPRQHLSTVSPHVEFRGHGLLCFIDTLQYPIHVTSCLECTARHRSHPATVQPQSVWWAAEPGSGRYRPGD
jgi:hypothetical protein